MVQLFAVHAGQRTESLHTEGEHGPTFGDHVLCRVGRYATLS